MESEYTFIRKHKDEFHSPDALIRHKSFDEVMLLSEIEELNKNVIQTPKYKTL